MATHNQGGIDYRVVVAGYDEMDAILDLSEKFFSESNYAGHTTYAPAKLRGNLFLAWQSYPRDFITFVLVSCYGEPAGYAHVRMTDFYTQEPIGDLFQFYVLPHHRGTGGARALRDAVEQQFKDWDCRLKYVECGAGLDDGKNNMLFFNLWSKIGYKFLGSALFKRG